VVQLLPLVVMLACTGRAPYEGDDPGECSDGADNDRDGWFDCDDSDDSDCTNSPDCVGDGGGADGGATDDGGADGGSTGDGGADGGSAGDGGADGGGAGDGGADGGGAGDGGADGGTTGDGGAETTVWSPAPGTTWQWQLTGRVDTSVDAQMYDIDLFDVPTTTIDALHAKGRVVICYFSAGSYEDWRPDAGDFDPDVIGDPLEGWKGENWLDIRADSVRDIMKARLDLAVTKGCDGVEPDNVDGYTNATGLPLTRADQLDYLAFLSEEGHDRGLSVGLKNLPEDAATVVGSFDWSLDEECLVYDECTGLRVFIDAGKAVFHTEYVDDRSEGSARLDEVCGDPTITGFSTLIKTWDLDAWALRCD